MNLPAIEDCLQLAAQQSSVWAVVREADEPAWVVVLEDQTLMDVRFDADDGCLHFRAELGMVNDTDQRHAINELILRSVGVIPMPMLSLGPDHRYELLASCPADLQAPTVLAREFDHLGSQTSLWREVIAQPLQGSVTSKGDSTLLADFGLLA